MHFYVLASGSKGNCCVITGKNTKLIIDCGSTKHYLLESFKAIDLDYQTIDALLLTHSHSDHISQLKLFNQCLVYSPFKLDREDSIEVIPFESFQIGEFTINPIPLSHDVGITVGYIIQNAENKFVYITDTGYLKQDYYTIINNADYYVFESNHDISMLMKSQRPYPLKQRIISDNGHLDNETSAEILANVIGNNTKEIVLAHLSEVANTPLLALTSVRNKINDTNISIRVAYQYKIIEGGQ